MGGASYYMVIYIYFTEDMQEMKREMKSLQDKNMMFMQQNLDLEDVRRFDQ